MNHDFARYIEIVGRDKIKQSLKEALQDAALKENWSLVKEITELIENYIGKNQETIIKNKIQHLIKCDKKREVKNEEKQEIWNTIKQITSEQFNIEIKDITTENDPLINSYMEYYKSSWSSSSNDIKEDFHLHQVELVMAVEEEFDIEISDKKAEKINSIQDLFDTVIYCLEQQ